MERLVIDSDEPASFRLTRIETLMHEEDLPALGTASPVPTLLALRANPESSAATRPMCRRSLAASR